MNGRLKTWLIRGACVAFIAGGVAFWLRETSTSRPGRDVVVRPAESGAPVGSAADRTVGALPGGKRQTSTPPSLITKKRPSGIAALEANPDPNVIWNEEKRDPIWAPKMEMQLGSRFEELRAKFDFKNTKIKTECRESTCYLSFDFDKDDLIRAQDLGGTNPQMVMVQETGVWAEVMYEIPVKGKPVALPDIYVGVEGDGRFSKNMVLLFGEEEIDPDNYAAWLARQPEEMRKLQAQAAEEARRQEAVP